MLLLKGDASQFDREALIIRLQMLPREQYSPRLVPPPELRQRDTMVIVNLCSRSSERLRLPHNLPPAFLVEQFLDGFEAINLRRFRRAQERNATEQDCTD